ncbi:fimbrial protein [Janthinobacterium sp. EB271-G4-7A]|uniref:fimbrial protein n=1 Tax=Janthinobacterium sp. EB271-G4-7A TaxID=2775056 RepID=UPI001E329A44|nr:fimbrial protein [Janthinobacterium sp. EB271-G4-7A]MCC7697802.1 type 1 fimbrial protein [Janthinobacterium sp. EB271-G4-7A]
MKSQARIFAVLLAAAATQSAFASDGTINFEGELLDSTCTVTVNGVVGPAPATVTLPKVSAAQLKKATDVAGQTGFNITLSACTGTTTKAAAFFESGSGVNPLTANVKNSDLSPKGAKFVELQLVDATNGNVIKAGDFSQTANTSKVTKNAAGNTILPYAVQYISTGVASAGLVKGAVTYSITYE